MKCSVKIFGPRVVGVVNPKENNMGIFDDEDRRVGRSILEEAGNSFLNDALGTKARFFGSSLDSERLAVSKGNLALNKNRLEAELANQNVQKVRTDRDHAYKLWKDVSATRDNMDESNQKLFDESDQSKQVTKLFKTSLPEVIGDDGKVIWADSTPAHKDRIEESMFNLTQKLEKQGFLSKQEAKALAVYQKVGPDKIVPFMDAITKDDSITKGEKAKAFREQIMNLYNTLFTKRSQFAPRQQQQEPQEEDEMSSMFTEGLSGS